MEKLFLFFLAILTTTTTTIVFRTIESIWFFDLSMSNQKIKILDRFFHFLNQNDHQSGHQWNIQHTTITICESMMNKKKQSNVQQPTNQQQQQ